MLHSVKPFVMVYKVNINVAIYVFASLKNYLHGEECLSSSDCFSITKLDLWYVSFARSIDYHIYGFQEEFYLVAYQINIAIVFTTFYFGLFW